MKEIDIMLEKWIPVNTIIREEFRNVIIKAMNEHADNMLKLYTEALDVKIKEQMSEIKNDVEEVAVIVTNQSSMPHGEQTIRWISKYNCYNKEGSTYQGGGEIKGYSGGYDVTIFYTDGTQIVLEGGLPYPEALRIAKKEKYKKKPTEEEVELTCCGDEITNLVKEIGLCPTCLEHI
jgi:hypothetical protein